MGVRVKMSIEEKKVGVKVRGAWHKALQPLSEEILSDCNEFCKMDTGNLIMSSLLHSRPKDGTLVWRTPYAKRQYWEIRTAYTDVNPRATWKWCEAAKSAYMSRWEEQAQRLVRMFING